MIPVTSDVYVATRREFLARTTHRIYLLKLLSKIFRVKRDYVRCKWARVFVLCYWYVY
jgi:hypothetical protein